MKSALRSRYREDRSTLDRLRRQAWTAELNRHLLAAEAIVGARSVGAYLAFDGEPDVRFTLTQLARRGVTVALPVLPESPDHGLSFRRWTPATPLRQNDHGISEPHGTETIAPDDLGVLLIPLVAWDRSGRRLGMGGGWYDRTLALPGVEALRIGVAWSLQEAASLPEDPWDRSLDAVVTEQGWFTCPDRDATMSAHPAPPAGND